jgi:hypothetical protein
MPSGQARNALGIHDQGVHHAADREQPGDGEEPAPPARAVPQREGGQGQERDQEQEGGPAEIGGAPAALRRRGADHADRPAEAVVGAVERVDEAASRGRDAPLEQLPRDVNAFVLHPANDGGTGRARVRPAGMCGCGDPNRPPRSAGIRLRRQRGL